MFKKVVLVIAIFVCLGLGVYFTYFHRPPTADILAANLALNGRQLLADDEDDGCTDKGSAAAAAECRNDPARLSARAWNRFIKENNFVSIGNLYNTCSGYCLSFTFIIIIVIIIV